MPAVIRFSTDKLDALREPPNPINPIFGQSLLVWLRNALSPTLVLDEPAPEDWGWYAHLAWEGQRFMLGACASDEVHHEREWILQVVPERSLADRLLGRGRVNADHPLVQHLVATLAAEPGFTGVTVESAA